jgi:ribose transport system ATP-binding protein
MDEPTAALSAREAEALFVIIRRLKERGMGIIYISHKLEEIRQIGDRVSILRDGANIATVDPKTTDTDEIVALMVGKGLSTQREFRNVSPDNVLVEVREVANGKLKAPVSFDVRAGEILGITGLVGAGKTELARALYGADPVESGSISLVGKERVVRSPAKAVDAGLGYLPEDRDSHGLFLNLSVVRNIALGRTVKTRRSVVVSDNAERRLANQVVDSVNVKTRSIDDKVKYLSGGNKQKVILGRWLNADCTLLVLDEPTIGIDVGARQEIYDLIKRFVERGDRSVLFVSSDMDEVLHVCDRILVMSGRALVAELDPAKTDKQEIMRYSIVEQSRVAEGS